MNNLTLNSEQLWMDQSLISKAHQNKQNLVQLSNDIKISRVSDKNASVVKKLSAQIPFTQRFKDKLFAFNKVGQICKLHESDPNLIKASMVFRNNKKNDKPTFKSIFRNRKFFVENKKIKIQIAKRNESKQTKRQTKSLDASKILSISGQNRHRYACNYSQIKEEQIEETIVKKPSSTKTIDQYLNNKIGKQNIKRSILFEEKTERSIDINQKKSVRRFFTNKDHHQNQLDRNLLTPNFVSLDNQKNFSQKQVPKKYLPRIKTKRNQYSLSNRQSISINKKHTLGIGQENALPKIQPPIYKKSVKRQKERLLTIR